MKRMCFAALAGALAISTMAVAVDTASAAVRGGAYRGGVHRGGVHRVGVGHVGIGYGRAGIGYGRAGIGYGPALAYRGGWNGGRGLGVAGVAGVAAAGAYYGDNSYASAAYDDYDASGGYTLHGAYLSEADAVAYCAQRFRSYDIESRTFLAYSGQRVSCPQ